MREGGGPNHPNLAGEIGTADTSICRKIEGDVVKSYSGCYGAQTYVQFLRVAGQAGTFTT